MDFDKLVADERVERPEWLRFAPPERQPEEPPKKDILWWYPMAVVAGAAIGLTLGYNALESLRDRIEEQSIETPADTVPTETTTTETTLPPPKYNPIEVAIARSAMGEVVNNCTNTKTGEQRSVSGTVGLFEGLEVKTSKIVVEPKVDEECTVSVRFSAGPDLIINATMAATEFEPVSEYGQVSAANLVDVQAIGQINYALQQRYLIPLVDIGRAGSAGLVVNSNSIEDGPWFRPDGAVDTVIVLPDTISPGPQDYKSLQHDQCESIISAGAPVLSPGDDGRLTRQTEAFVVSTFGLGSSGSCDAGGLVDRPQQIITS